MVQTTSPRLILLALAVTLVSCSGVIEDPLGGSASSDFGDPQTPAAKGKTGDPSVPGAAPTAQPNANLGDPMPVASPIAAGNPSLLRRMSRDELITTFEALLGASPARDDLPEDERVGHGSLLTTGVAFVGPELGKLRQLISEFTAGIAPAMLQKSGCTAAQQSQQDCLAGWALKLAEKAFRRALSTEESTKIRGLFEGTGQSKDDDTDAVRAALNAIFFAPAFVYRVELGMPVSGNPALRNLRDHEIATRLSYLATLGPPDAELLESANAGRLKDPAERGRQLERLTSTERGRRAMALFVLEWMGANESKIRDKSAKYLEGLGSDFDQKARTSAESAIRAIIGGGSDPSLGSLFTTNSYLTDPVIQALMKPAGSGPSASGDTPETGRTGLLMHPFVLSAHTKEDGPSPFQIGVFIRESLLCEPVPPPPPNAADMAKDDPPAGLTMRQDLEYRTNAAPVCKSCHDQFSSLGFSFLPFDPVGRWVKQDPTGKPWDLTGEIKTRSGVDLLFNAPGELTQKLAVHPQVQECFANGALHWVLGREAATEEQALVQTISEVARRTRASVPAMFKAIVESPSFVQTVAQR
jgi:hypothetical protein